MWLICICVVAAAVVAAAGYVCSDRAIRVFHFHLSADKFLHLFDRLSSHTVCFAGHALGDLAPSLAIIVPFGLRGRRH